MAGLRAFKAEAKDLGNTIRAELGAKLKQVVSVVAIEQAVQRTAQWANEIDKTSKAMGVTAAQLQTLHQLAGKAAIPEEAMVGMFENVVKAQKDALSGNQQMIMSFQKLGVNLKDLMNLKPSELFDKVMGGIPDNFRESKDLFLRPAIQNVTGGTPENFISAAKNSLGDKSFASTVSDKAASGDIVSEATISELSKTWEEFVQAMKDVGVTLAPLALILLAIAKDVVNAFGAIFSTVMDTLNFVLGLVTLDGDRITKAFQNISGLFMNLGYGLTKLVTGLVDWVSGLISKFGKWIGFKNAESWKVDSTAEVTKEQAEANKGLGLGQRRARQGEGAGNVLGALLTVGEAATARITSGAGRIAADVAERIPGVGRVKGSSASKAAAITQQGLPANVASITAIKKEMATLAVQSRGWKMQGGGWTKVDQYGNQSVISKNELIALYKEAAANVTKQFPAMQAAAIKEIGEEITKGQLARGGAGLALSGREALAVLAAANSASKGIKGTDKNQENKPILDPYSKMFNMQGPASGSGMLKFGGMFGSGDNRLIKLNQKMVEILSQIQFNTAKMGTNPTGNMTNTASNSFGGNAGGI